MASPNIYPSGLNLTGTVFENGPATLQLAGAVWLSGAIQWLDTINGNNANGGTRPELPVKTLAQAVTNSAANGVIIVGEGSSETLSGSQSLALANLSIFGCGVGSSRPRYTCNGLIDMFSVAGGGAGTWIEGFYFPASTSAATDRIAIGGSNCTIKDCYFECGALDTSFSLAVNVGGTGAHIDGCSFVTVASRPAVGLAVTAAVADTTVTNCTFDGGSYGWSSPAFAVTAAATRIRLLNNTFANYADIGITVTATSYQIYGNQMDGTAKVLLTA